MVLFLLPAGIVLVPHNAIAIHPFNFLEHLGKVLSSPS
jgi:hypothetical protein